MEAAPQSRISNRSYSPRQRVVSQLEDSTHEAFPASIRAERIFSEAIGTPADIAIVELSKTRLRFSLGLCLAEFTLVVFKDRECQTVAVESTDPVELLRLIDALELADKLNLFSMW
jgi:hypothetical protein